MFGEEQTSFYNVTRDFMLWDTVNIGEDVPTAINGWFPSFAAMALSDVPISFFNQRQEGETGTTYTNMKKKTGLDWPADFESLGIRFNYPDPVNVDMFDGDRCAAKVFQTVLVEQCSLSLFIGGADTKILSLKPAHASPGFGPVSNQSGPTASYTSVTTMGDPLAGNRWRWIAAPLTLPKDISIEVQLTFTKKGKEILTLLNVVQPIEFLAGSLKNWASIEIQLRGTRQTQQDGAFHR
jgi:hypothetical protein